MHKELATLVPLFRQAHGHTGRPLLARSFELIIPLGLWWRKTRVSAVLLGIFFHWFLYSHPHGGIYSFSHLLYVLYAVFLFSSRDNPFDTRIKVPRFGVLAIKLAAVFLFGLALFLQCMCTKMEMVFLQLTQSASTHGLSSPLACGDLCTNYSTTHMEQTT